MSHAVPLVPVSHGAGHVGQMGQYRVIGRPGLYGVCVSDGGGYEVQLADKQVEGAPVLLEGSGGGCRDGAAGGCAADAVLLPVDEPVGDVDAVAGLYAQEDRLVRMITTASWISLLISVIGILGLVYFETQFRRKEIAVRRVHGASVGEILLMLNRYYLRITAVCFVVAVPVAWFIIRRWVSSFPYQSPVPVWIFLVALVLVSLITAVTVTLQSRRAALRNPVDSISSE